MNWKREENNTLWKLQLIIYRVVQFFISKQIVDNVNLERVNCLLWAHDFHPICGKFVLRINVVCQKNFHSNFYKEVKKNKQTKCIRALGMVPFIFILIFIYMIKNRIHCLYILSSVCTLNTFTFARMVFAKIKSKANHRRMCGTYDIYLDVVLIFCHLLIEIWPSFHLCFRKEHV